jgi:peptide/nickel transport system substrate-binding protein
MHSRNIRNDLGISRVATIIIVVVIVVIIAAGGAFAAISLLSHTSTTSSTTTSTTGSTSTTTTTTTSSFSSSGPTPSTLTWETTNTITFLDPAMGSDVFDTIIQNNVYEHLLWFNGSSPTQLIPWLASSYTVSSDQSNWNFTLRNGINFADGEPLNSTSVYFSLYRMLLTDGSFFNAHGATSVSDTQQFLNVSLSSALCCPQTYNAEYVHEVLAQNFVQITGPKTFTLHLLEPSVEFGYVIAGEIHAAIVAPVYVMEQDLALWNQSSTGYTLPYPNLSGNLSSMIQEYFLDEVATCNSGITPTGCGTTYLDGSYQGSLAGTGPYTLQSVASDSSLIVLKTNPNYWGGPYQYSGGSKITPTFTTIDIKNVPQLSTREIDLESAASSGQALIADIPNTNLYDVANRSAWLTNNNLISSIPGISLYGPDSYLSYDAFSLGTNVTNPTTGQFYTFQPFADLRIRLAFADSINFTLQNQENNNNLGVVANGPIPPGTAPPGSYNASLPTRYSYNLTAVQDLLLSAMMHPITQFTFYNGTAAPPGVFNNTFGCPSLGNNGQCSNPVSQTITMIYMQGDTLSQSMLGQIASAINNVSATYNMGLNVLLEPLPSGEFYFPIIDSEAYFASLGQYFSYNYVTPTLDSSLAPGGLAPGSQRWNITALTPLYNQAVVDTQDGNTSGLVKISSQMLEISNQEVQTIWTIFPENFYATTSIIHGVYYNSGELGIYYFATMT